MTTVYLLKVPPPQSQRFCTGIKPSAHELWGTHPNHSHAQRKHAEQRLQDAAPPTWFPTAPDFWSPHLPARLCVVLSLHSPHSYFWPETSHTISASCRREAGTPRWSWILFISEKRSGEALSVRSSWDQRETGGPRWSCAFETQNPVSKKRSGEALSVGSSWGRLYHWSYYGQSKEF